MSLNDTSVGIGDVKGTDVVDGLQNPTVSTNYGDPKAANFVNDPTSTDFGAGVDGSTFKGHENATRELREQKEKEGNENDSGESTIADTQIEPIGTDPGQATGPGAGSSASASEASAQSILEQVTDAAKAALSSVTGQK